MRTRKKKFYLCLLTGACILTVVFVAGELVLRLASPTEYLHPRYKFSPQYGLALFENSVMVHGVPGKFRFEYTVNGLGYRGREVAPGDNDRKPRIIILGDSYAFGMGVNDGEEFPAVLDRMLGTDASVINLACPGWGLTQQIRRFYDVGRAYRPAAVILQFCANDPADNFVYKVTGVENGEFVFHDSYNKLNWIKKYLSRSIIQRSQLYNFFRQRAYRVLERKLISKQASDFAGVDRGSAEIPPQEALYRDLLELFALELRKLDLSLIMISVDGQLDDFPWIKRKVLELDAGGDLEYLEVTDWLRGTGDYFSVEGHVWGAKAHAVIGEKLAAYIRDHILVRSPSTGNTGR